MATPRSLDRNACCRQSHAPALTRRATACYPTLVATNTAYAGGTRVVAIALLALALSAPALRAEPKRWATVAGQSQVTFEASFPLGDFTGTTEDLAGEFLADTADLRQGVTG